MKEKEGEPSSIDLMRDSALSMREDQESKKEEDEGPRRAARKTEGEASPCGSDSA